MMIVRTTIDGVPSVFLPQRFFRNGVHCFGTNTLIIGEIPFELGLKTVIVCTCKMVGLRSRGNITIIDKKGALVKLNINK